MVVLRIHALICFFASVLFLLLIELEDLVRHSIYDD